MKKLFFNEARVYGRLFTGTNSEQKISGIKVILKIYDFSKIKQNLITDDLHFEIAIFLTKPIVIENAWAELVVVPLQNFKRTYYLKHYN